MAIKSFLSEGGFSVGSVGSTPVDVIDASGNITAGTISGSNLTLSGNLTVNGTTVTLNSTTTTLDDPIITLGGDTAPVSDDNKDRGVEFRWHNGTAAKVGFFGYRDSNGKFVFIPDATNSNEVFSGTVGAIDLSGSLSSGSGISFNSSTGAITNTGVTSITGTSNQVTASAGTGAVTLSLPQDIATSSSPTFTGVTATTFYLRNNASNYLDEGYGFRFHQPSNVHPVQFERSIYVGGFTGAIDYGVGNVYALGSGYFGSSTAGTPVVIVNAAQGTAQGGAFGIQGAGTWLTGLGTRAAIIGGGTDQSTMLQSYADNVYVHAVGSTKAIYLQINSANKLTVDNSATTAAGNLVVQGTGTSSFAGNLTVSGAAAINGGNASITSASGVSSYLLLNQTGVGAMYLTNIASTGALAVQDGANTLLSIARTSGNTSILGNLTVQGTGVSSFAGSMNVTGIGTFFKTLNTITTEADFALRVKSAADDGGIYLGANSTVSVIQAIYPGNTWSRNLSIQPNGGNLGIGTTSPSEKLHVAGTVRIDGTNDGLRVFRDGGSGITSTLYLANSTNTRAYNWQQNSTGNGLDFWTYDGTSWANRVTYLANGNVGINNTNPTYRFEISGQLSGASGIARIGSIDYGSSTVLSVAPGVVNFDAPGIVGGRFTINSSGNVGINNTSPAYKLDVTGPIRTSDWLYIDTSGYGIYSNASGLYLSTAGNNWDVSSSAAQTWSGLRLYSGGKNVTWRGHFYGDSTGQGFLDSGGGWALMLDSSARLRAYSGVYSIDNQSIRVLNPGGAVYGTGSSIITGAWKIKLPTDRFKSNTMMRMTIKIYRYSTGKSVEFNVGGYNYNDAAANWYNCFAEQQSDDVLAAHTIRFGNDGTSQCIWIGETTSTWDYPQVFVTDFQGGFQGSTSGWANGWSITPVTAFDTVTQTRTAAVVVNTNNISTYGVTSITGTSNQVIASASTGAVTLSLPQSIATTSTPTFGGIAVGGSGIQNGFIADLKGNTVVRGGLYTVAGAASIDGNIGTTGNLTVSGGSTSIGNGGQVVARSVGSGLGITPITNLDINDTNDSSIRLWRATTEWLQFAAARAGLTGQNNVFLFDIVGPNSAQLRPLKFRQSSNGGTSYTDVLTLDSSGNTTLGGNLTVSGTGTSSVAGPWKIKPATNTSQLILEQDNATSNWNIFCDSTTGGLSFIRNTSGTSYFSIVPSSNATIGLNTTISGDLSVNNVKPAAGYSVDWGFGTTIKRVTSDGHLQFNSQNGAYEFTGTGTSSFSGPVTLNNSSATHVVAQFSQSNSSYNTDISLAHVSAASSALISRRASGELWLYTTGADAIKCYTNSTLALTLGNDQNTTFAGNVAINPVWNNASTNFTALNITVTDTLSGANSNLFKVTGAYGNGMTVDKNGRATITSDLTINNQNGNATGLVVAGGNATFAANVTVSGNLTVNGTTTTVNSTTSTIKDPVITLGGGNAGTAASSDDNKDRGIEFKWHNGTSAKTGFFGFQDSTGYLTFIPDATNTSEVFSGTLGDIQAGTFRGTALSVAGSITEASATDQALTLNATDNSWKYIGFQWSGSRRLYFGLDSAGAPIWGSDVTNTTFQIAGSGSSLTIAGNTALHAGNYNSYAPTLTGTGASGTWGINITGTASGETLSTVTGRGASTGSQISVSSGAGGSMFTGTKAGSGYTDGVSGATFKSITDNPNGGSYAFAAYYGGSAGTNSFFVGAGGNAYFKDVVGIGTTSPSALLQVSSTGSGNFRVDSNGSGGHYYQSEANPRLGFGRDWDGPAGYISFNRDGNQTTYRVAISSPAANEMGFYTASGEKVRINSSGSVGIGTTSPGTKLDVVQNSNDVYIRSKTTTAGAWLAADSANDGYFGLVLYQGGTTKWTVGQTDGTADLSIKRTGTDVMRILSGGNVGIGTTSPGYKLEVNGSFAATTKSFVIKHPTKEGKKLRYGSLEGPENGVYVRGKLKGTNIIELPDYWTKLVDPESITVQLTPIGSHQKLYVEKIVDNKVYIANENLLAKAINCFYYVLAERADVEKLEVEIDAS